jgi:hypothetical protein
MSGIGSGRYRHYESVPGGDFQLKIDADLRAIFDGRKYRVDLKFDRDMLGLDARRVIYDGESIADVFFNRNIHPSGAQAWLSTPELKADGLARLAWGDFPWDVTSLARNVCDPERLRNSSGSWRLKIEETSDGDLLGLYSFAKNSYWLQFEWPRRFGFNLSRMLAFNPGEDHPYRESNLHWKQDPSGLWYVVSLQETFETRNERGRIDNRFRAVLMYAKFEPNAKVDRSLFSEDPPKLPARSQIVDNRTKGKVFIRLTP